MADIFRFNAGGKKIKVETEGAGAEAADAVVSPEPHLAEVARYEKLRAYYDALDVDTALKTKGEDPNGYMTRPDLAAHSLAGAKTMTHTGVEKVAYDEIIAARERAEKPLSPREIRALGMFLGWRHFGWSVEPPAGLLMKRADDPSWSNRVGELLTKIAEKKKSLVASLLDDETRAMIEVLYMYLESGWPSEPWVGERQAVIDRVKPGGGMGPREFLESAKRVSRVTINGDVQPTNLERERQFAEVEAALDSGKPVGNITHATNQVWNNVGAIQRERENEMAEQRTAATYDFLRQHVREELVRRQMAVIGPEEK